MNTEMKTRLPEIDFGFFDLVATENMKNENK
jgi:hypothetical protein